MRILGQFRSLDDDDRFVWMRGFPDMSTRANALATFYGGPAWQAHKAAANATMIDSDDVLLLHPAHPNAGFAVRRGRTGAASGERPRLYVASVHTFEAAVEAKFALHFDTVLAPLVARYGGNIVARLATERSRNTYPALPVRENENAFVWLANFADAAAYAGKALGDAASTHFRDQGSARLQRFGSSRLRARFSADPPLR